MNISEAKELIERDLKIIEEKGLGYITPRLKLALFQCISNKDWNTKIIPFLEEEKTISKKIIKKKQRISLYF